MRSLQIFLKWKYFPNLSSTEQMRKTCFGFHFGQGNNFRFSKVILQDIFSCKPKFNGEVCENNCKWIGQSEQKMAWKSVVKAVLCTYLYTKPMHTVRSSNNNTAKNNNKYFNCKTENVVSIHVKIWRAIHIVIEKVWKTGRTLTETRESMYIRDFQTDKFRLIKERK